MSVVRECFAHRTLYIVRVRDAYAVQTHRLGDLGEIGVVQDGAVFGQPDLFHLQLGDGIALAPVMV